MPRHALRNGLIGTAFAMVIGSALFAADDFAVQSRELSVHAQHCAIFYALTGNQHPACTAAAATAGGLTRGIVLRDPVLGADEDIAYSSVEEVLTAAPGTPSTSRSRSFSRAAIPAAPNPAEQGYFIQFAFDSAQLREDYKDHLRRLSEVLQTAVLKDACIKVVGHTDTVGGATYNTALSHRRAVSVQDYLTNELKIPAERVTSDGLGEDTPLPDVAGGHPKNRRVEILSRNSDLGCT